MKDEEIRRQRIRSRSSSDDSSADGSADARRGVDESRRRCRPKLNPCTHGPNNPGQGSSSSGAHGGTSSRLISVSKASAGPSDCTYNPGAPPGQCPIPPAPAKAP
ncbi:hypothetical protein HU200_042310 [Digitaria exilis]|uniref:Uncharacterized protein n=1 Tax=Digitaria exilis TaxID=1010633 RepID=A0A835EEX4_9POAL|nr:hypothetical protein HU200_042310 [Digitaria exilis]